MGDTRDTNDKPKPSRKLNFDTIVYLWTLSSFNALFNISNVLRCIYAVSNYYLY